MQVAHDRGADHVLADYPFAVTADLDRGARWGAQPLQQFTGQGQHLRVVRQGRLLQLLAQGGLVGGGVGGVLLEHQLPGGLAGKPLLQELPQTLVGVRHNLGGGLGGALGQRREDQGERVDGELRMESTQLGFGMASLQQSWEVLWVLTLRTSPASG